MKTSKQFLAKILVVSLVNFSIAPAYCIAQTVYVHTETKHCIGARGIDWISFSANGGGAVIGFPIYDGHGNMIYTLKRETGNDFSLNNRKVYDVWGGLRNGSGGVEQQHCANLGHRVDDESGLIYMRARYYEPWTGRFISEDPSGDGWNWFVYCSNNPVNLVDCDGMKSNPISNTALSFGLTLSWLAWGLGSVGNYTAALVAARYAVVVFAVGFMVGDLFSTPSRNWGLKIGMGAFSLLMNGLLKCWQGQIGEALLMANLGNYGPANFVVMAVFSYSLLLIGAMISMEIESEL